MIRYATKQITTEGVIASSQNETKSVRLNQQWEAKEKKRKGFVGGKPAWERPNLIKDFDLALRVMPQLCSSREIKEHGNKGSGSLDSKQGGKGADVPH